MALKYIGIIVTIAREEPAGAWTEEEEPVEVEQRVRTYEIQKGDIVLVESLCMN